MDNKEISLLLNRLQNDKKVEINIYGFPLAATLFDNSSKLSLSTRVFHGGNYIPTSVRNCLMRKESPVPHSRIFTSLSVDEPHYSINLNYLGKMESFDRRSLEDLVEEFCWIAEEWRGFLDEHGRHDLVHVHFK